ncbi:MBL fold metallo-hydrolase [Nocardioides mangrovi]|uniref:MBL fold metallo-hydrolase n=1 Tax=Nocardioides mangrovi TaxID=2874580 RepID=A0ABS7UEY0_9ACTN|nr:MBL fold metallo-hydrolase [Nocardioides mangrovi]MBZ5739568.1 MBL fold metallo-hydrolase [Nocardioides mangrovi]
MPGDPSVTRDPAPLGRLDQVADGVFAWIQEDGTWWINNAGYVAGDDVGVLIDTCTTEARTRALLDAVDAVAGGRPLAYALNTHHHGDHTYGNSLLEPTTVIVGQHLMREGMLADRTLEDFPPFWSPTPEFGDLRRRAPGLTFGDRASVHLGGRQVDLVHPGYTAHTDGDAAAWVPDVRVLFVGDLLFPGHTPMIMAGVPSGAIRSLAWIDSFDADIVVPGHGPVIQASELAQVLALHEAYYEFVLREGRRGIATGLTPLEVARSADLGEFGGLLDPERFVLNVHSAYAELRGGAVDRKAALADAVAWMGRAIHTKV